jgi:hypothetical protein
MMAKGGCGSEGETQVLQETRSEQNQENRND